VGRSGIEAQPTIYATVHGQDPDAAPLLQVQVGHESLVHATAEHLLEAVRAALQPAIDGTLEDFDLMCRGAGAS
jgi:hypothetical protein